MSINRETVNKVNRLVSEGNWKTYNIGAEAQDIIGRNGDYSRESVQSVIFKDMKPKIYDYGTDIYNAQENTYEKLTWENIQRWLDEGRIREFLKEGDCIIVPATLAAAGSSNFKKFHFWVIGINTHNGQTALELEGKDGNSSLEHIDFCGGSYRWVIKGDATAGKTFFNIDHNNGAGIYNNEYNTHFWQTAGSNEGMFNKVLNTAIYCGDSDIADNNFFAISGLKKENPSANENPFYLAPKTLYLGKRVAYSPVFDSILQNIFYADEEKKILGDDNTAMEKALNNFVTRLRNIASYYQKTMSESDSMPNLNGNESLIQDAMVLEFLIKTSFDTDKYLKDFYSFFKNYTGTIESAHLAFDAKIQNPFDSSHPYNISEIYDVYHGAASSAAALDILRYSINLERDSVLDGFGRYAINNNTSIVDSSWALSFLRYRVFSDLPSIYNIYLLADSNDHFKVTIPENVLSKLQAAKTRGDVVFNDNEAFMEMKEHKFNFDTNNINGDILNKNFIDFGEKIPNEHAEDNVILNWIRIRSQQDANDSDNAGRALISEFIPLLVQLCNYFNTTGAARVSPFSEGTTTLPRRQEIDGQMIPLSEDTTTYLWGLTEYELFGQNSFGDAQYEQGQLFQYPILKNPAMRRNICKDLHKNANENKVYLATLTTANGSSYNVAGMQSEDLIPVSLDICSKKTETEEGDRVANPIDMPICFRMQQNIEYQILAPTIEES